MNDFIYIIILLILVGLSAALFLNRKIHIDDDLEDIIKQQKDICSTLKNLSNEFNDYENEYFALLQQNEKLTAENTELKKIILEISISNTNI